MIIKGISKNFFLSSNICYFTCEILNIIIYIYIYINIIMSKIPSNDTIQEEILKINQQDSSQLTY